MYRMYGTSALQEQMPMAQYQIVRPRIVRETPTNLKKSHNCDWQPMFANGYWKNIHICINIMLANK